MINKIGKISYKIEYDHMGKFGLLHKGRCDETLDKATILSVLKTRFAVDFDILQRSQTHNNVIKYFCHEEKPKFW